MSNTKKGSAFTLGDASDTRYTLQHATLKAEAHSVGTGDASTVK